MTKLKYIFDPCKEFGLPPQHLWWLCCTSENNALCIDDKIASQLQDFMRDKEGKWYLTPRAEQLLQQLDQQIKGKTPKRKPILIPQELLVHYREMFPNIKFGSGKHARSPIKAIGDSFQRFFAAYPDMNDWDTIMLATELYLREFEAKNWEYCTASVYFPSKLKNGQWSYLLAEYYERVMNGDQPEAHKTFEPTFS